MKIKLFKKEKVKWFMQYGCSVHLTRCQKKYLDTFTDSDSFSRALAAYVGEDFILNTLKITLAQSCAIMMNQEGG